MVGGEKMINTCLVLAATLHSIPCEYVIDFGAEAVPFTYSMLITLEARDGSRTEDIDIRFTAKTDPTANRTDLALSFESIGWSTRRGPGNSFVVIGLKNGNKSPIKSVTLTSPQLIPVQVRWVPLPPPKEKK
jgi:hypothetical protein